MTNTETSAEAPGDGSGTIESGMRARIQAKLAEIADEVAQRQTRVAIAVPGKEITAAMFELFSRVPQVPSYDPETAGKLTFCEEIEYLTGEIPDDPAEVRSLLLTDKRKVRLAALHPQTGLVTADLTADVAEQYALQVLAAAWALRELEKANRG